MVNVALPLESVADEEYVPLVKLTDPVAAGALVPPLTVTVTLRLCGASRLEEAGVTVTVGVILFTVTLTEPVTV
jgi:hypothetical protein